MNKASSVFLAAVTELRAQKFSYVEIASKLQCSKNQVEHALSLVGLKKKRLTDDQKAQISKDRMAGMLMAELEAKYGVTRATLSQILKNVDASALKTDKAQVLVDYDNGMDFEKIGLKHGLTKKSVMSIVHRAGASNRAIRLTTEQTIELVEDRKAGLPRKELADKYGLSEAGVKKSLNRTGTFGPPDLLQRNITDGIRSSYLKKRGGLSHIELMRQFADSKGGKFVGVFVDFASKTSWECAKGHLFEMRPNSVQQGQWCPSCAHVGPSRGQLEAANYVKELGFEVVVSTRELITNPETERGLELDVYVPSKDFAIEYNGLLWHSDKYSANSKHHTKAILCREQNIELLAIFEDEWRNKTELVKAMVRHRLGLFGTKLRASKLEVKRLDKNIQFKEFFERNHLDGHAMSKYAYGLFLGDKLISCLSVRTNHQGEREIARFATDYDYHVYGGAGRLIKAVMKEDNSPLVTFSNNRLSVGKVYQQLGFVLVQENKPSYWYTDGNERVWRFKCKRINDPAILAQFPEVPHTEKGQAAGGVFSMQIWGDRRPLYRVEDYGHRKWILQ